MMICIGNVASVTHETARHGVISECVNGRYRVIGRQLYQSITLNGDTHNLNWAFGHGGSAGWYGITINYQMDGNQNQDSYNIYLDELTFSYQ